MNTSIPLLATEMGPITQSVIENLVPSLSVYKHLSVGSQQCQLGHNAMQSF